MSPLIRKRLRSSARVAATLCAVALSGCNGAPSQNILGAYFPSWMFCAIAGLIFALLMQRLLAFCGVDRDLPVRPIVYLAMATAFAFAAWLLWLS